MIRRDRLDISRSKFGRAKHRGYRFTYISTYQAPSPTILYGLKGFEQNISNLTMKFSLTSCCSFSIHYPPLSSCGELTNFRFFPPISTTVYPKATITPDWSLLYSYLTLSLAIFSYCFFKCNKVRLWM